MQSHHWKSWPELHEQCDLIWPEYHQQPAYSRFHAYVWWYSIQIFGYSDHQWGRIWSSPQLHSRYENLMFFVCCFTYGDKLYTINFIRKSWWGGCTLNIVADRSQYVSIEIRFFKKDLMKVLYTQHQGWPQPINGPFSRMKKLLAIRGTSRSNYGLSRVHLAKRPKTKILFQTSLKSPLK